MSTQRWIRLDVGFARNPKVLGLLATGEHTAVTAYVFGLLYCGEQGTEGFIPHSALLVLHASVVDAQALCQAGLWIETENGWQVNDWREYQPALDSARKRSDAARKAAQTRWKGKAK